MSVVKSIIKLDARVAGYEGEPVRVMAITLPDSGKIQIAKLADWREPVVPQDDVVVITDTPQITEHWSMAFYEREDIKDLIKTYLECKRSGLIKINDGLRMYDPDQIMQTAKVDERGQVMEFDSNVTNGHLAVLLAVWGARKAYGGYVTTNKAEADIDDDSALFGYANDNDFDAMMPFSVGG